MKQQVIQWYTGLSSREKVLVGIAAALFALVFTIYGVYFPLTSAITEKRLAYREALERRVSIEAMADNAAQNQPKAAAIIFDTSLETLINQSAAEAGFTLEKVDASGSDRAVITITQARPPALLKWLAELELQGVITEQIDVKAGSAGTVGVNATLVKGGR
ncbi:type II secretion system protein GspM [Sphingorhabdus buctiana]|jgi:general secretion pathway protein M|uniref:Type II secretion system protein GspM n=1 Tax=Sphingorhabdus buctiana TaxID=1508805 RepID=A0ABW4MC59_9SPHN